MDGIEFANELHVQLEGIGLDELEGEIGLWVDVHAYDFKSSQLVALGGSSGAAEEVEKAGSGALGSHVGRLTRGSDIAGDRHVGRPRGRRDASNPAQ